MSFQENLYLMRWPGLAVIVKAATPTEALTLVEEDLFLRTRREISHGYAAEYTLLSRVAAKELKKNSIVSILIAEKEYFPQKK